MHQTLNGTFRIIVTDKNGMIKDTGPFNNLILNSGLDSIGNRLTLKYIRLGTGTSTPVPTQTNLDSQVASRTAIQTNVNTNLDYTQSSVKYSALFPPGTVSSTIREVGIGWESSGDSLFSRVLTPTPIVINSTDQIEIIYTLTTIQNTVPVSSSISINGISYPYTVSRAKTFIGANSIFLPPKVTATFGPGVTPGDGFYAGLIVIKNGTKVTGYAPSQKSNFPVTYASANYIPGTYYLDCTSSWTSSFNFPNTQVSTPIKALYVSFGGLLNAQVHFTTPIPKTNNNTISLTFRSSWGR